MKMLYGKRLMSTGNHPHLKYDLASAMHIPLIVLGLTESSCKVARGLIKLGEYEPSEIEFFMHYSSSLKLAKGDDPQDPSAISEKDIR